MTPDKLALAAIAVNAEGATRVLPSTNAAQPAVMQAMKRMALCEKCSRSPKIRMEKRLCSDR